MGTGTGKLTVSLGEAGAKVGEILISSAEKWTVFEGATEIDPGVHQICFRYEGEKKVDLLEFELL